MKTKNIFGLGLALATVGITTPVFALSTGLDTFDTFAGEGGGQLGFNKTDATTPPTTITGFSDVNDNVGPDSSFDDFFFITVLRTVNVRNTGPNNGDAIIRNGIGAGGYSFPGKVSLSSDDGVFMSASLSYALSASVDLIANWDRFKFIFDRTDVPGSMQVDVTDASSAVKTVTVGIPAGILVPTPIEVLFSSLTGLGNLATAKTIKFTLVPSADSADWRFDSVSAENPNIPEASTMIPALAFAGVVGYFGWRRSQAKAA